MLAMPCEFAQGSAQLGRQSTGVPEVFLYLLEALPVWELTEHHQVQDLGEGVFDERFDRTAAVVQPTRVTVDE